MEPLNTVRIILLLNDKDASHLTQSRGVSLWLARATGAKILEMEVPLLSGTVRKRADAAARRLVGGNRRDARDWLTMADGDSLMRRVGASFAEHGVREGARDILIISAGESAAPYNLALGYIWRCHCATVMRPGIVTTDPFDFAVIADHEFPERKPNIFVTLGSVNSIEKEKLACEAEKFLAVYPPNKKSPPKWSVIVGGDDDIYALTPQWVKKNLGLLLRCAVNAEAELYIDVSKKITPQAAKTISQITSHSENVRYLGWKSAESYDPIEAMLGFSDAVFCTEDLHDNITNAITAGHKVVLMKTEAKKNFKKVLQDITASMIKAGAASQSLLWGKPKYDMLFDHFLRYELMMEFKTWQKSRHDAALSQSTDRLVIAEDFNEARRAAEWIISNWG